MTLVKSVVHLTEHLAPIHLSLPSHAPHPPYTTTPITTPHDYTAPLAFLEPQSPHSNLTVHRLGGPFRGDMLLSLAEALQNWSLNTLWSAIVKDLLKIFHSHKWLLRGGC